MRALSVLCVAVATLTLGGYAADVLTATPLWTFDQNEGTYCSPSLRNNTVFVGSASGAVHALDRNFGTLLWSAQVNDAVNGSIGFDDIMIDAPEIYVPTIFGTVYALNGATGQQVWKHLTETTGVHVRPAAYNRSVYVDVADQGIWLLNATGGLVTTDSGINPHIQRAADGNVYLFVGGAYGSIMQVNLELNDSPCDLSPAQINNPLYRPIVMGPLMIVNDDVGNLFGVDYTLCQRRWNRTLPFGPNATVQGYVAPIHDLNLVVVASANGHVAAVDAYNGSLRWSTKVPGLQFSTLPLAADGYVFVLDLSGVIAVLSAADGKLLQRVTGLQATTPWSRLAFGGGVLVATFGSTVAAFGLAGTTSPATNVPTVPPTDTAAPASVVVMSHCTAFNCASGCEHAKYPLNTCVALSNSTSVWRTCARSEMRVQVFDSSDSCASGTSSSTRYYKLGQCVNDAESGGSFIVESC